MFSGGGAGRVGRDYQPRFFMGGLIWALNSFLYLTSYLEILAFKRVKYN